MSQGFCRWVRTWVWAVEALYRHCVCKEATNRFITATVSDVSAGACRQGRLVACASWVDQLERDPPTLPWRRAWSLQAGVMCHFKCLDFHRQLGGVGKRTISKHSPSKVHAQIAELTGSWRSGGTT